MKFAILAFAGLFSTCDSKPESEIRYENPQTGETAYVALRGDHGAVPTVQHTDASGGLAANLGRAQVQAWRSWEATPAEISVGDGLIVVRGTHLHSPRTAERAKAVSDVTRHGVELLGVHELGEILTEVVSDPAEKSLKATDGFSTVETFEVRP